ncbi:TetR/AcrR family transcriptional regulator [Streptomyces reniochalinae]|uniref:TetR/AcrR family transcriptional regulator n=1 Tax=Streptomyces reniochalinae TaxID=2250578 RepID=A0A367ECW2_9ACTN|nr:TetR/AcrR family transcriptional regulator [Streptomyces reniochalinae]RCG15803.1 TetR/AcrR family transcriptional regulator [Streptomyces reniochalinae]
MTHSPTPRRRADARRSRAAILDAALALLDERPDASIEAVGRAAGVTRQTVYAHFPSRERLLAGVVDHLTGRTVAAMEEAAPDEGPAAEALLRLLDAAERTAGRYPALARQAGSLPASAEEDRARHARVADLLGRVVRRGQASGEFDGHTSPDWLVAATIALAHASSGEADAGRLSPKEARRTLRTGLLRLLGAEGASGQARSGAGR